VVDRRERVLLVLTGGVLLLVFLASAIIPGRAASIGSSELVDARPLMATTNLDAGTGLTVVGHDGTAFVSTGDGGGAGLIEGFDARALRARSLDGDGWEIGTEPGRPAARINRNGVRLDDGMLDRLRMRWLPEPALVVGAAFVALAVRRRRGSKKGWAIAPALLVLAVLLVSFRIA
jgi:hypothetical protein